MCEELRQTLAKHLLSRYGLAAQDWDGLPDWKREILFDLADTIISCGGPQFATAFIDFKSSSKGQGDD